MEKKFSALGYGFHLEETIQMLDYAVACPDKESLRDYCLDKWPQKSLTNKVRMWNHLSSRYLDFDSGRTVQTPFLKLYEKIRASPQDALDLIFFQLCYKTPLIFQTLRSLATDSFLNTGEAVFSKYHLDQLLENIFGHIPKSTCERICQILIKAGRLTLSNSNYSAKAYCPSESVLGYALYQDAETYGWRAPSTTILMEHGTVTTIFLCNRPLFISGINHLASKGHCEYHQLGQMDQIQLTHRSLEDFVNAWK